MQHNYSTTTRPTCDSIIAVETFPQRERFQAAEGTGRFRMDGTACEISAGDAKTLAEALEEAGTDMAELMELCRLGALFIQ
jgi:hypothetical protein